MLRDNNANIFAYGYRGNSNGCGRKGREANTHLFKGRVGTQLPVECIQSVLSL